MLLHALVNGSLSNESDSVFFGISHKVLSYALLLSASFMLVFDSGEHARCKGTSALRPGHGPEGQQMRVACWPGNAEVTIPAELTMLLAVWSGVPVIDRCGG